MVEKGVNLFDECISECVHLCPQLEECISSSWGDSKMYTPGTIANSQRIPTKINKNSAIAEVRILVKQVILYGIERHLEYFQMKSQSYFLSYVDDISVVCICIQIIFLIFTCISK